MSRLIYECGLSSSVAYTWVLTVLPLSWLVNLYIKFTLGIPAHLKWYKHDLGVSDNLIGKLSWSNWTLFTPWGVNKDLLDPNKIKMARISLCFKLSIKSWWNVAATLQLSCILPLFTLISKNNNYHCHPVIETQSSVMNRMIDLHVGAKANMPAPKFWSTVEPRLSGLVGTSVKSPDNRESG